MKTFSKMYALSSFLILAFVTQASGQSQGNSHSKATKTTTVQKTVNNRVPSTKVTYKTPMRKVVSVRSVPNKKVIKYSGQDYYYANNKYYTQSRGRYIVIAPKIGFRLNTLPPNNTRVRSDNHNYFNAQGVFYVQINNEYVVVEPEIGTIVYELPEDYEKIAIDGLAYYEYANIIYEKIQLDGTRAYQVVGIIDLE